MSDIVAYVPNLMDRSKLPSDVVFVRSSDGLAERSARLIVVDIDRCEDLSAFVLEGVKTIGFGPHVESEVAARAVEAGFQQVVTRSYFFKRCKSLLS